MRLGLEIKTIKRSIRRPELTEVVVRDSWHCIAVSSGIVSCHFLHILVTSHYQLALFLHWAIYKIHVQGSGVYTCSHLYTPEER